MQHRSCVRINARKCCKLRQWGREPGEMWILYLVFPFSYWYVIPSDDVGTSVRLGDMGSTTTITNRKLATMANRWVFVRTLLVKN